MLPAELPDEIFRAYDIRGIVGESLTPDMMFYIGQALASEALDQGEDTLIQAADARLSSPALTARLQEGILATGCNVLDIGLVPTPLLYFATHHLLPDSGLMVTGSHNPKEYNGLKMVLGHHPLSDVSIRSLQQRIRDGALYRGRGRLRRSDIRPAYTERICADIHLQKRFKVVIDCGNGVAGNIAPQLFRALGCEVVPLFCTPDGNFPNHHPDPTEAENLQDLIARVRREKADLGIAFDGDGDRVGLVTGSGEIIDADQMLMSFARDILPDNPGATIVYDVKSSQLLKKIIEQHAGVPLLCKSGHSYVKQALQDNDAILGGEYSAHIFFRHRWYGFDDGLYTACRFLELMDKYEVSADAILSSLPRSYSTPELKLPVSESRKFQLMESLLDSFQLPDAIINTLDGIRADFADGWGLIRASNTTPNLVLRFEASSRHSLEKIMHHFRVELERLFPELELTF